MITRIAHCITILFLCLGLLPMTGYSRVIVETEIVSGTISKIEDGAVELDFNGIIYYPDSEHKKLELQAGKMITLRYYVDQTGEPIRKYVEFAPGENSLAPFAPPPVERSVEQ